MNIKFKTKYITNRSTYDRSAMEAGALNANYQDTEAAIHISNRLGEAGYEYHKDFYFITCYAGTVVLEFYNKECASTAAMMFSNAVGNFDE